jgi:hypothetical protein
MTPIYIIACIDTGDEIERTPRLMPILKENNELLTFKRLGYAKHYKRLFEHETDMPCLIFKKYVL